jgi:hypothetical protein
LKDGKMKEKKRMDTKKKEKQKKRKNETKNIVMFYVAWIPALFRRRLFFFPPQKWLSFVSVRQIAEF